jgi:hypothetical protein
MEIREATFDDAVEACIVLKRSIAELCHADHKSDPMILARWLGIRRLFNLWVQQPDNSLLVAVEVTGFSVLALSRTQGQSD